MCWRDDIIRERRCIVCKQNYYGSLGHIGCPGFPKEKTQQKIKKSEKNKTIK